MKSLDEMFVVHNPPKTETRNCSKHGDYVAVCQLGIYWTRCEACRLIAEEETKAEESRKAAADLKREMDAIGIPERFREKTFDTFNAQDDAQKYALEFSKNYAANFGLNLKKGRCALFLGKVGTGKTHLATSICLDLIRQNKDQKGYGRRSIRFTSVSRMLRRIKDTYKKGHDESERQAIEYFTGCDLLVIDEIGVQFGTDYEKNTIFDIINDRYEAVKPTILMSNLTIPEVKAYLGDRAFDRLRENGGEHVVFGWDSYRGKAE